MKRIAVSLKRLISERSRTFDRYDYLILTSGILLFVTLSLLTITASSVWFDESFGAYLIRFDFGQIWHYTAVDVHPPLYYWLLKVWGSIFGMTELGLRSMSVVCGAIAIGFAYAILRRYGSRHIAVWGIGLAAIAPMIIRYSQEMRMYALVIAIALAATYVLMRATELKRQAWGWWIVYGVLVALGMWTHYFMAIVWLAHWVWRLWSVRSSVPRGKRFSAFFSRYWIGAHVLAIGLFLPWLPSFVAQVVDVQGHGFWIPAVTSVTLLNYFTNNLFYLDADKVNAWLTIVFMVVAILLTWFGVRIWSRVDAKLKPLYVLLLAMAIVPPLLLIVTSLPPLRSTFIDRYLVTSSLSLALLVGFLMAHIKSLVTKLWIRVLIILLLVGSLLYGVQNVYNLGNLNKNGYTASGARQTVEAIRALGDEGEPILAASPWFFYDAVFYEDDSHPIRYIDEITEYPYGSLEMLRTSDMHKIKDFDTYLNFHDVVWFAGRPGDDELEPPSDRLVEMKRIALPDPITGRPAYQAVQYRVVSAE